MLEGKQFLNLGWALLGQEYRKIVIFKSNWWEYDLTIFFFGGEQFGNIY